MNTIAALVMLLAVQPPPVDNSLEYRTVTVSGTYTIQTPTDRIRWSINLSDLAPTLLEAKAANDAKLARTLDAFAALGVTRDRLQISFLQSSKQYDNLPMGLTKFKGWQLSRSISYVLEDLERLAEFADKIFAIGDVEASYTQESSKFFDYRKQARAEAAKAAREKAVLLCEAAGAKLGPVRQIRDAKDRLWWEQAMSPMSNGSMVVNWASEPDAAQPVLMPGDLSITETVYVVYDVE